jgi:hypothetical protein
MSCAVCLSELVGKKLGVLECTHEFCFECIQVLPLSFFLFFVRVFQ